MTYSALHASPRGAGPVAARRAHGFTMAELLITVVIIGVATAIGLPMMRDFVNESAASGQAEQVLAALNYTRSEAVKRNSRVTMCHSDNGTTCGGTTGDWHTGWLVFIDGGTVGSVDGTDVILRVQGTLTGKATLVATGGVASFVSYTSGGQPRDSAGLSQSGALYSCQPSTAAKRRRIAITPGTGWVGVEMLEKSPDCTDL